MAIVRATRASHLYQIEQFLDQITGVTDHEPKLDLAFSLFLIDFRADVGDPANVTSSDAAFILPVAYLTVHLYYEDLMMAGEEIYEARAHSLFKKYRELFGKVRFTLSGIDSEDSNVTVHTRLML